jgi:hypothetical protein
MADVDGPNAAVRMPVRKRPAGSARSARSLGARSWRRSRSYSTGCSQLSRRPRPKRRLASARWARPRRRSLRRGLAVVDALHPRLAGARRPVAARRHTLRRCHAATTASRIASTTSCGASSVNKCLVDGCRSGKPHATSKCNVHVDAVHRLSGQSPSLPCELRSSADPARLGRPRSLCFPFLDRRVEQVAHHLPPDGGITVEQPLDYTGLRTRTGGILCRRLALEV